MLNKKLSPENALNAIQALNKLLEEIKVLVNTDDIGFSPSQVSKGYIELNTFERSESVLTAYSQGATLFEASADHLFAFVRTLTEPMLSIAPWSCARSALEACAFSTWILDPRIDVRTRVQRSLAFRYGDQLEQLKIARLQKTQEVESNILNRIDSIEETALNLGFEKVLDRNGKRIGVGVEFPKATKLIGEVLDEEFAYRILSGIVHGQSWAFQALSFQVVSNPENSINKAKLLDSAHFIERNLEPIHIVYFCSKLAKAFIKTVHFSSIIFGWNEERLEKIIKEQPIDIGLRNYDLKSLIS